MEAHDCDDWVQKKQKASLFTSKDVVGCMSLLLRGQLYQQIVQEFENLSQHAIARDFGISLLGLLYYHLIQKTQRKLKGKTLPCKAICSTTP